MSDESVNALNPTAYLNELGPDKPIVVKATRAPTTADRNRKIGTLWVDRSNNQSYQLTNVTSGSAVWTLLGPGASDVDTLTGDSGGPISPSGGNITLAGGTNITSVGAGSTITFNLDAAISLSTSVTSPIYTTSSADMNITAASSQNIIMQMGDSSGATRVTFRDSTATEIAFIASTGAFFSGSIGTSNTATALTLSANSIDATGSDANVDISLTPQGTGNVDVVTGNLDIQAGNLQLTGAATQLQMEGGAVTDFIGSAVLVAGSVVVANTNIAANDLILLSRSTSGGTPGNLSYVISAGASFTINSSSGTDTSTIAYVIVRQL